MVVIAFCGLLSAGCGSSGMVPVKGKVLLSGKPYVPDKNEQVMMVFQLVAGQEKGKEKTYPTGLGSDGIFTVQGADGKGIPPGK